MESDGLSQLITSFDGSYKYILLGFNFITLFIVFMYKRKNKPPKQHNILFVTAHPDDESMFFRPTILTLNQQYFIHILCLTGKNTERQQQLKKACEKLKITKFQILQNDNLKDSMSVQWKSSIILEQVYKYINQNNIKAVFTFDGYGVSNHANHKSIYKSFQKIKSTQQQKDKDKIIKIYYLESVNLLRKYTGAFQFIIAIVKEYSFMDWNIFNAWSTMALHKSQFVYFRKLWVIFSRYNFINTYQREFIDVNKQRIKQQ